MVEMPIELTKSRREEPFGDPLSLPLTRIVDEGPEVKTYYFSVPQDCTWTPGAHLHVGLPELVFDGERHPDLVRHMSICTLPGGELGFTTRLNTSDSHFKSVLRGAQLGDQYTFFRCGCAIGLRRDDRPVVLLSQGVGVAAMRPLSLEYQRDQRGVPLLVNLTVDRADQGIFEAELAGLGAPNYLYRRARNRADFAESVRALPQGVGDLPPVNIADSWVAVIGSDQFMADTVQLARSLGADDDLILVDLPLRKRTAFFAGLA